jgi:thiopeptide-type bacteriocin biosynthesis protein
MSAERKDQPSFELTHSGFFVLRSPLLPASELAAWSQDLTAFQAFGSADKGEAFEAAWLKDVRTLRERLRSIVDRPEIIHALYVASPSLLAGIEHWKRDPNSKKGLQAERALVRYFVRMCARSTPFGLFSGCSVGRINDREESTTLHLKRREESRLCCRLDFDYLFSLTASLRRDPKLEAELQYRPNSSLHRIADAWYYVESRMSETKRTHHLVKIESDAYLEAAITAAETGATVQRLIEAVLAAPGDADPSAEEAQEYVLGLIRDNEILVSDLVPLLTGLPPLDDIIQRLESIPSGTETATALRGIRSSVATLESAGLNSTPSDYQAITAELENLPAKIDLAHLYQVDMIKSHEQGVLGKAVIAELIKAVEIVWRFGETKEPDELKSFREAFSARYEMAKVPLLDALDEESGVGFGAGAAKTDASPLLRGLRLRGGGESDWKSRPAGVHPDLLRQVVECIKAGRSELELDLSELGKNNTSPTKLADAFCVMGALVADSPDALEQGNFELFMHGAFGPSGARLLGRFCHEDPDIEAGVREHLRQEEAHDPEAIYAEVTYLPEGRIGNVLCRPVLREYEIPYLARSGAPPDRQLPVSDLLVGIEQGNIVLYSRKLNRRIIPRVTNAHGFMNPELSSVYRFLCFLQHQHGVSVPAFSFGVLGAFNYLPRVRVGRIIFSLAQWRLSGKEVEIITKEEDSRRFAAVQNLRQRRNLPRWVVLQEGDNSLPVDLDNALSVDAFVHVLKRGSQTSLMEMYPTNDRLCVGSPEGYFHHELTVPIVRKRVEQKPKEASSNHNKQQTTSLQAIDLSRTTRILPPGSEWLYVKLYGGTGTLDDVLTSTIRPMVHEAIGSGNASQWFFIRYADPHDHLRIRFQGIPNKLSREVLPLVYETFNPLLASGKLWKIEFDTYHREVERYGGIEALLVAEELFHADSEAVLDILQELAGDEGLDVRWRVGLMGVDRLLNDSGLDDEAKRRTVQRWRHRLQDDFKTDAAGKKQLAERFRAERRKVESSIDESQEGSVGLFAKQAFQRRSALNIQAFEKLRALDAQGKLIVNVVDLLASYAHMHMNRLIRASQVAHEFVIYDFLFQLYESKLARQTRAESLNFAAATSQSQR